MGESAKRGTKSGRGSEKVKLVKKRVQDEHKKERVARRQAKQRDEDLRIQCEGLTHRAGV